MSSLTSSGSGGDLGHDVKCLEHSTLKVPYEVLNKKFRFAQKVLDRECSHVVHASVEMEKFLALQAQPLGGTTSGSGGPSGASGGSSTSDGDSVGENIMEESDGKITGNESKASLHSTLSLSVLSTGVEGESCDSTESDGAEKNVSLGYRPPAQQVSKLLGVLMDRLQSLKRKAGESIAEEIDAAGLVRKRLLHLKSYNTPIHQIGSTTSHPPTTLLSTNLDSKAQWKKTRLNRMLVDHLLREGNYDTAGLLADTLGIRDLTNVDVFTSAKEVEDSLRLHQTSRMVSWCYENKSKLRKLKSTLELEVRVQEFVELVRRGQRMEAVRHARKYLADSDDPEHMTAVKKCMGLLAFPVEEGSNKPAIHPYYELLSPARWDQLIIHFRLDHARMYQLSRISVLGTVVQAGLAALKTPHCYRPLSQNPNCPVCSDPLNSLAKKLPYAHCAHSQLVCAVSGEPLNENNPPMVLPSGFVYGTKSLKEMAKTNNGKVICGRSGRVYNHAEAERVFVM